MVIATNTSAMNAYRNLNKHNSGVAKALERLSSGLKLNRAADDPSGLCMSQRMKAQLRGMEAQEKEVLNRISATEIEDGTLADIQSLLNRMTELATKAASENYSDTDREAMDAEYQQLLKEIDRVGQSSQNRSTSFFKDNMPSSDNLGSTQKNYIMTKANFDAYLKEMDNFILQISTAARSGDKKKLEELGMENTQNLSEKELLQLSVSKFAADNAAKFGVVASSKSPKLDEYTVTVSHSNVNVKMGIASAESLGLKGSNLKTSAAAGEAMTLVKDAINKVSKQRSDIGSTRNRLESTMNNLATMQENLSASISRITDADMAKEMMNFVREKALEQMASFALAQANQRPKQIVSLLYQM